MNGVLSNRLVMMSELTHEDERPYFLSALRLGATMALARISELGGNYPTGSDFKAVMTELDGQSRAVASEAVPPASADVDNGAAGF